MSLWTLYAAPLSGPPTCWSVSGIFSMAGLNVRPFRMQWTFSWSFNGQSRYLQTSSTFFQGGQWHSLYDLKKQHQLGRVSGDDTTRWHNRTRPWTACTHLITQKKYGIRYLWCYSEHSIAGWTHAECKIFLDMINNLPVEVRRNEMSVYSQQKWGSMSAQWDIFLEYSNISDWLIGHDCFLG